MKKYTLIKHKNNDQEGGKRKKSKKKDYKNYDFKRQQLNEHTVYELNHYIDRKNFIENEYPKECPNYLYTPAILPAVPRLIALGDIHGDYNLAIDMLKKANLIDLSNGNITWIGGNTVVVQVGDQIDRCRPIGNLTCENPMTTYNDEGNDTKILRLFTDLDIQARSQGGMVISLLGNHELMNSMGLMNYVSNKGMEEFNNYKDNKKPELAFNNSMEARIHAFKPGNEYGKFMGCTRLPAVIVGSNLFVHAGIINMLVEYLKVNVQDDLETINIAVRKWLLGMLNKEYVNNIVSAGKTSMFWTRVLGSIPPNMNFNNNLCSDHISNVLEIFKVNNLVVGHTPQSFIYSNGINSTCDNRVWRVDNGSSKAFHKFDQEFLRTGNIMSSREAQVLEIINDTTFNVIK